MEIAHDIELLAIELGAICVQRNVVLCGAESCTGGLIAGAITSVSGSSKWFDRGFVTYSNEAKSAMLGVNDTTLNTFGAVSEATAREMAGGALQRANASLAFSVTGVAGPTGGTAQKPVGMVCFGFARGHVIIAQTRQFDGDRSSVRRQSVKFVLHRLIEIVERGGLA